LSICRGQFDNIVAHCVAGGACRLRFHHLQVQEKPLKLREIGWWDIVFEPAVVEGFLDVPSHFFAE
jgi:hypothetical protein